METEREKVIRLLAQLRSRTVERGCTEAEAMQAAEKAAALMAEYQLTSGDVEICQEDFTNLRSGSSAVRSRIWAQIAAATNTAPIFRESMGVPVVTYVGAEPGPSIAVYLHQVCDRAIDREAAEFRKTGWYRKRRTLKAKKQATSDFTMGMVRSMGARLQVLFASTISDEQREAAQAELDRRWPDAETTKPAGASGRYYDAAAAGVAAGGRVTLAHGVAGSKAAVLAIGVLGGEVK